MVSAGRMWRVVGVVALVAIAAACVPEEEPPPPPPPPPKVFVVYGDSLVGESMAALSAQLAVVLPGWEIRYQVWGGTAQCDFHPSMIDDATNFNVGGVAIAFSGNNLTGCIQSRPYVEGYREDAHWAVSFWRDRGIPVLFVAAPGVVGAEVTNRPIPNVYIGVGSALEVPVADSAPLFARGSPAVFARDMPCLEGECTSTIVARHIDGVHFCPADPEMGCPPSYSSGAVRYAEVIAGGIAKLLGITHALPRSMVTTPTTTAPTTSTTPSSTTTSTSTATTTTSASPAPSTTTTTTP